MRMTMTMRMKINKKKFFLIIYKNERYYQFNRQEILQKAKEKYSKEKLLNIIYKTKKL